MLFIDPNIVLNVKSPILAVALGIVSGLASTGSHEVITKVLSLLKKMEENKND